MVNAPIKSSDPQRLVIARGATWLFFGAMILAYGIWQLTRAGGPSYFFWSIQMLPLLLVLPGLVAGKANSFMWLCYLMLAYFIKGFDGIISPSRAWIDYFVISLSCLLFISSMLTGRWLRLPISQHQEAQNVGNQ
jgi:uncharacterized membrane protein